MVYQGGDVSINTIKKEIEFYKSEEKFSKEYLSIFSEYRSLYEGKVKRNDLCLCGSEKKYKKCCLEIHERCISIYHEIHNQKNDRYSISPKYSVEREIEVFRGPQEEIPTSKDREIFELLKKENLGPMR
ncbi:SEC-C domain-containing protein [Listeria monocytogenes]|nr:SEC-C domain-containing protein [Listeria monocytogenes]EHJ4968271.1 SEC-C domain-containing protein [Listeria monocytogenes]EHL2700820.1 SEC-C domain-containing protein [Listeria monocytogenes]EHL5879753.1 SEC-C domain-containing protein [Listeria monocytogenes]EHO9322669.1 SEC-C domain-containing protein [Listeria monocytogenes]